MHLFTLFQQLFKKRTLQLEPVSKKEKVECSCLKDKLEKIERAKKVNTKTLKSHGRLKRSKKIKIIAKEKI